MEFKDYEALFSKAEEHYELKDRTWFNDRSDEELAILWSECIQTEDNPLGAAWDDEVYDTITAKENKEKIFKRARLILRERDAQKAVDRINTHLDTHNYPYLGLTSEDDYIVIDLSEEEGE